MLGLNLKNSIQCFKVDNVLEQLVRNVVNLAAHGSLSAGTVKETAYLPLLSFGLQRIYEKWDNNCNQLSGDKHLPCNISPFDNDSFDITFEDYKELADISNAIGRLAEESWKKVYDETETDLKDPLDSFLRRLVSLSSSGSNRYLELAIKSGFEFQSAEEFIEELLWVWLL